MIAEPSAIPGAELAAQIARLDKAVDDALIIWQSRRDLAADAASRLEKARTQAAEAEDDFGDAEEKLFTVNRERHNFMRENGILFTATGGYAIPSAGRHAIPGNDA